MCFWTGGAFPRWPRPADLGAARLALRGIERGSAPRESRPRPRPVFRAARSQSRKHRINSAGEPSGSAVPSGLNVKTALGDSHSRKKRSVNPIQFPYQT